MKKSSVRRYTAHAARLLLLTSILATTGCFEVFQTIDTKRDGTIRMSVRITMSRSLQKDGQKMRTPEAKDFVHDARRIHNNLKARDLSDEITLRQQFDFSTSRDLLGNVSESDRGMFLPYPDGERQWVFVFRPSRDGNDSTQEKDDQRTRLATAILSTAYYRIYFRGKGLPATVAFTTLEGKRHQLRPTPFGDGMLVDCPLILLFQGGVLTTSTEGSIDFERTDDLLRYLSETTGTQNELQESEEAEEPDSLP